MRAIYLGAAAVLALAVAVSGPLAKSKAARRDVKVSFAGCPILQPVEGGCLTVKSNGQTYLLNAASPRPDPALGRGIIGSGIWRPGTVSICMMGKPLRSIHWQYSRMKCRVGKKG